MYFGIEGNLPVNDVRVWYPELVDVVTLGQSISGRVYLVNTGSIRYNRWNKHAPLVTNL